MYTIFLDLSSRASTALDRHQNRAQELLNDTGIV